MTSQTTVKTWFYILYNHHTKLFFLGQAKDSRKDQRHKDPDYTKLLGTWNLLKQKHSTHWIGIKQEGAHQDKKVHPELRKLKNCISNNSGQGSNECFILEGYTLTRIIDVCKDIVEKIFNETVIEKDAVNLRSYQKEFVIKIASAWEKYKNFLLFAKCRAGKSVMTLTHVVEAGYKLSLVVSRLNSPAQSWQEDPEKYQNFDNLRFVEVGAKNWKNDVLAYLENKKQVILYSTVQYLSKNPDCLDNLPIDFLVFDECHIGGQASEFVELREQFDCNCLYISGTAFDLIEDFSVENSFVYSYFDEQLLAKNEGRKAGRLIIVPVEYNCAEKNKLFGEDVADSIENVFLLNKDESDFLYPFLVNEFISKYLIRPKNVLPGLWSLQNSKHIYAALPSQKACDLLVNYIEKSNCIFTPLSCHSGTKVTPDSIKSHLERYEYTICLTVTANVLGVTAPWDTIMMLNNGESAKEYTQMIFRGGSRLNAETNECLDWLVVDFCPDRCIRAIKTYYAFTTENNPELAEYDVLNFISLFDHDTGFSTPLSQDYVDSLLVVNPSGIRKILTNTYINQSKLMEMSFDDIKYRSFESKKISFEKVINTNGANGKSALSRISKQDRKDAENELQKKYQTILNLLNRFPEVILLEQIDGNRVRNLTNLIKSSHFENVLQEEPNFIQQLVNSKVINTKDFNDRIFQADMNLAVCLNNGGVEEALREVYTSESEHDSIPAPLLDDMMETYDLIPQ
jgi:hypothetical protein